MRAEVRIRAGGIHNVNITRTIDLSVEVGSQLTTVMFYVVHKIGTYVILGYEFCNKHIETILQRRRLV